MYNGTKSVSFLRPKIWEILPESFKKMERLEVFKMAIKTWKPENCICRPCWGICLKYWISMNNIELYRQWAHSTISHINYWDQLNSWKKFWKFWNGPLCRNKSAPPRLPFILLNVVVYWQSSNTEACAKKLSQILANNTDNGGRGIGLTIYVWYCLKN